MSEGYWLFTLKMTIQAFGKKNFPFAQKQKPSSQSGGQNLTGIKVIYFLNL